MRSTNKILFFILMLFLSSVVLISYFQTRQVEPLKGTFTKVEKPQFSWTDWISGVYQEKMDVRTNSRFFIRSVLLKVRNQVNYTLFDKVNAKKVMKGKKNVLYENLYIDAYLGLNFIGKKKIDERLDKIKFLQDTLAEMNKTLLVVIAASKAHYYPDNFPAKYDTITKKITNYDYYMQELNSKGIKHLDFNKDFLRMKDTVTYPLFSKKGIHWSHSSKQYVWNTIVDKLEENTNWNLARLEIKHSIPKLPRDRDRDIYNLLNIYGYPDTSKMLYHLYHVDTTNIDRPLGMVVGDSFFWGLKGLKFSKEVLNDGQYWYYNKSIYPSKHDVLYNNSDYDIKSEVLKNDIIILLSNPANLVTFPFGFEAQLHDAFLQPATPEEIRNKEVKRVVKRIKKDKEWFENLTNESKQTGIEIDSLVFRAADDFLKQGGES